MKALVLAGGRGNRLAEIANSTNKCMLTLLGKPILEYNLERAAIDVIDGMVIVVGYKAEDIISQYGVKFKGKRIEYVLQREQRGLVHAIACAEDSLRGQDFFLLLGDEVLVGSRHESMVHAFIQGNFFGLCGVVYETDPNKICKTYTVMTDAYGRVLRLVEKPTKALSNWQGTGHCVFKNAFLSYIAENPTHQDLSLIQCAIDDGKQVNQFDVCDRYANVNSQDDLHEAKQIMKERTREELQIEH